MDKDELFMAEALKLAKRALSEDEVPIGAIIVAGDKIIAKGYNQTEKLNDVTAHAEILAITSAAYELGSKYLRDCTLYVTVEPCPMCAAALAWSQIGRIVYGADDPKRGFSRFSPSLLHPKTELVKGLKQEECSSIISNFFKEKRNLK